MENSISRLVKRLSLMDSFWPTVNSYERTAVSCPVNGEELQLIPSLNCHPVGIEVIANWIHELNV